MAKRETSAGRPKNVTDASVAAGVTNLAKGREAKRKKAQEAKAAGAPRASERWAMLLDGRLGVDELDDTEIKKMRVRGADGGFAGRRPAMPSHLAQAFQREALRRANERFRNAAPQAVKGLIDIANDPDVKPGDRIRAYQIVLERSLGKVPETIRLEAQDTWGDLLDSAMGAVERDLPAEAEQE